MCVSTSSLKYHLTLHNTTRPYLCKVCGKTFLEKGNCNSHELRHCERKTFECLICHKKLVSKDNLKQHMRRHSLIKPFSCSTCGKLFSSKTVLKRHQVVHIPVRRITRVKHVANCSLNLQGYTPTRTPFIPMQLDSTVHTVLGNFGVNTILNCTCVSIKNAPNHMTASLVVRDLKPLAD